MECYVEIKDKSELCYPTPISSLSFFVLRNFAERGQDLVQIDDKLFQFALNCINCFNHMDRATPRAARLAAPGDQLMAKGPSPYRPKRQFF